MDLRVQLTICPTSQTPLPKYTMNIVFLIYYEVSRSNPIPLPFLGITNLGSSVF